MAKLTKNQFEKYLLSCSPAQLLEEMLKLYSHLEPVRLYYENELNEDSTASLEKSIEKLQKEYMPNKGFGKARSSEARKIILEFKKVNKNQDQLIKLILFRTQMMLDFTNAYGDMAEAFYDTLAGCYEEACKLIVKNNLQTSYQKECDIMLEATGNIGYGLGDQMYSIFEEYFGVAGGAD
jgi:hypothetical protein